MHKQLWLRCGWVLTGQDRQIGTILMADQVQSYDFSVLAQQLAALYFAISDRSRIQNFARSNHSDVRSVACGGLSRDPINRADGGT